MESPDVEMMVPIEAVARFIESGGTASLATVFVDGPVTMVENFAPFVFEGEGAVAAWTAGMRDHAVGLTGLSHAFGPAHDFGRAANEVYFSLPTTWKGVTRGRAFTETGGWSFVLRRLNDAWRVRAYGWAVTGVSFGEVQKF
jgi:hypothetical protein